MKIKGDIDYYGEVFKVKINKKNIISLLKKIENVSIVSKFDLSELSITDFREIIKEINDQEVIAFYADKIEVGLSIFS